MITLTYPNESSTLLLCPPSTSPEMVQEFEFKWKEKSILEFKRKILNLFDGIYYLMQPLLFQYIFISPHRKFPINPPEDYEEMPTKSAQSIILVLDIGTDQEILVKFPPDEEPIRNHFKKTKENLQKSL